MPLIDALVHHGWDSQTEVMEYMSRGWREYLGHPDELPFGAVPVPILPQVTYHRPAGDVIPEVARAQGVSSFDLLREHVLDRHRPDRVVLGYGDAMFAPVVPNALLAAEVCRAANRWTIERWLSRDERLHALALVPTQTPDRAAAEIARIGSEPRIAGVLLAANPLGKPFGHPIYDPILHAAAAHDLPLVIHAGGDALPDALSQPSAGGPPAGYGEYAAFAGHALSAHLATLIGQGAFERYPGLRVLLAGGGVSWLPPMMWRFDTEYMAYRREAPWVKEPPSEYLRRHVRVTTGPVDSPRDTRPFTNLLESFGGLENVVVYASGYPRWDMEAPGEAADRFPHGWREQLLHGNAEQLFRWASAGPVDGDAPVPVSMERG